MTLKNDFFSVKNACETAAGMEYAIEWNLEHFVYQAHFPKNPITPGVCIIQIVKELSEEILKRKLFLKKVNNAKFLHVINPLEHRDATFSISISSEGEEAYKVGAVVCNENAVFAKLSLLLINR